MHIIRVDTTLFRAVLQLYNYYLKTCNKGKCDSIQVNE